MATFPMSPAKTALLLSIALLAAALLAACTSDSDTGQDTDADGPTPSIVSSGVGVASGEPDIAVVSLGVEALRDTVSEARNDAADALAEVIAELRAAGIAEDDIRTTYFSIHPRYEYQREGEQQLLGFQVTNTLSITVRDLEATGDVVDRAAAAGGDLIRVQSIDFQLEDTSALEEEARIQAIADAQEKADLYARELDIVRGDLISVSESTGQAGPFPEARFALAAMDSAGPTTQFFAGEIEVRVTVHTVFAIE